MRCSATFRFFTLVAVLCALAGCNRAPETTTSEALNSAQNAKRVQFPRDDLDRPINLKAPAERVAVIGPGVVETIFALSADEKLVGRDQFSDYPPEAKKIPVIGDYQGPAIEKTLAARPDLVIVVGESYGHARMDEWQKKLGVPVAGLAATNVKQLAQGIRKVRGWLGVTDDGLALANTLVKAGQAVQSSKQKAFIEIGRKPLWTTGKDTLVGDIVTQSGFENVANIKGYKQFNVESLLAVQPNVYIVTSNKMRTIDDVKKLGKSEQKRVLAELRRESGLKNLKAVKSGNVIVVPNDWLLRPGPRVADAIKFLSEQHKRLQP